MRFNVKAGMHEFIAHVKQRFKKMPKGGARPNSGPKKQYEARVMLKLSQEMLDGIDAVTCEEETRSDVIRRALEREIKRVGKKAAKAI